MRCQQCSTEIPDDSKFCPACGKPPQAPAGAFCPACGAPAPGGQRFCGKCGAQIALTAPPPPPGQPQFSAPPPPPPQFPPPAYPSGPPSYYPPQQNAFTPDFPVAGVMIRVGAALLDSILLLILGYIMAGVFGQTTTDGFKLHGAAGFLWWGVAFVYYIAFEGVLGATPAKMLLGLKVVKTDGGPCDIKAAVIRTVCRIVDHFFLLGVVIMLFSKRNQRLGDHLAGTLVVKTRAIKLQQMKSGQFSNFDD